MADQAGRRPLPGPARPVRDGLALGLAVGTSGLAFGAAAVSSALAGAVAAGGSPVAGAASAILLGSRNALYGLRLAGLLQVRGLRRLLAAQGVIDESTAVALAQPDAASARPSPASI